jgi:hypothetical protein
MAFLSVKSGICRSVGFATYGAFLRGTKHEIVSYVRGATPATGIVP